MRAACVNINSVHMQLAKCVPACESLMLEIYVYNNILEDYYITEKHLIY